MEKKEKDKFESEEQYIIGESPEISIGESPFFGKIFNVFPAFKNKNYNLYFWGQLLSMIGTWLQMVAQGWLVLQITNSAFWVGFIAAVGSIPTLLFSLFGGVIVDRLPKKEILIFTQVASMILALVLGTLTVLNIITLWEIAVLSFVLGTVNALDFPARQAFIPEIVERDQIQSAIALNSATFNGARVIGPAIAGVTIAIIGTGGTFILNGISYIAAIIGLYFIKTLVQKARHHLHPLLAIKEGLAYSFKHPDIRTLMILISIVSVFGWSYMTITPVLARDTFHVGPTGLGYLFVAGGLGALVSAFIISAFSRKISSRALIIGGNFLFAASVIALSFTNIFILGLVFMFLAGLGLLFAFPTINTVIQHIVPDNLRGRAMSIYSLMFLGFMPIGSFEIGFLSDRFGTGFALRTNAAIVLLVVIIVYLKRNKFLKLESLENPNF